MNRLALYARPIASLRDPGRRGGYEILLSTHDSDTSCNAVPEFFLQPEGGESGAAVDRWFVEHALGALFPHTQWMSSQRIPISINLSAQSIIDRKFITHLDSVLARGALPARLLTIRVAMPFILDNVSKAAKTLRRLRRLGCGLALNGFGIQRNALACLREIPATQVKLDEHLLRELPDNPRAGAALKTTMQLLHGFPCKSVADYVNSAAIAKRLRGLGVDYAQGSVFGNAEPLYEVLDGFHEVPPLALHASTWPGCRRVQMHAN